MAVPSFIGSARVLDSARLRKQQVEALQIINTLEGKSDGWKNHPAVIQWRGYTNALRLYAKAISLECNRRGYRNLFANTKITGEIKLPPWLGYHKYHSSHRSRLLFKGHVDATCYSLRSFLGVRSINEWLATYHFPAKNMFDHEAIEELEAYAQKIGCQISKNWYNQFGWSENDDMVYYWPSKHANKN